MSANINKKQRIIKILFLSKIVREYWRELLIFDGKYAEMKQFTSLRTRDGIQSVSV